MLNINRKYSVIYNLIIYKKAEVEKKNTLINKSQNVGLN